MSLLSSLATGARPEAQSRQVFPGFTRKTFPAPVFALVLLACCIYGRSASAAGTRWIPDRIRVDSIGSQYDINAPVSDGHRKPQYWRDSWASNERNVAPRWVEFFFNQPVPVEAVAIHWAIEDGHPKASGKPTTSRAYRIQAWQDNTYHDLVNVADALPEPHSLHVFDRVTTDRIRVWQPAGGGPAFRTNVMWITEIEVYDYPKTGKDFGTAADEKEMRHARETMQNRTIGFFRRCPSTGHAHNRRSAAMARPLLELARKQGWRTMGLDRLDKRELQRCRIVVLSGVRHIPNRHKLLAFMHNGGSVLFVHNACGRGGGGSLLPDLWEFKGMGEGELNTVDQDHPVTANVPAQFSPTWGEHARLRAGPRGVALVRDHDGYDVVVAGRVGRGRAIAIGHFPGLSSEGTEWSEYMPRPPEGAELALLTNSIAWLTHEEGMRDMGRETRALRRDLRRLQEGYQPFFEDVTEECGLPYYGYAKGNRQ